MVSSNVGAFLGISTFIYMSFRAITAIALLAPRRKKTTAKFWTIGSGPSPLQQRDESLLNISSTEDHVSIIVAKYLHSLVTRRDALIRIDSFGVIDQSSWLREIQHFNDKVVKPRLSKDEVEAIKSAGGDSYLEKFVVRKIIRYSRSRPIIKSLPVDTTPTDFEGICAATLRKRGWAATTTKGSGDQGADVIASFNGKTLVVQCKMYSSNVGNKAVQEVIAAQRYYNADVAAVVCTGGYTTSAMELAAVSGVFVLHYKELAKFCQSIEDSIK